METTMKRKFLIFGLMALAFLASVLAKQFLDTGSFLPAGDIGSVVRLEEVQAEEASGAVSAVGAAEAGVSAAESGAEAAPVVSVPAEIVVDVEGAVAAPGVVRLTEGSRVYEAVEAAGGALDSADRAKVNMAEKITDGAAIYIPFRGEEVSAAGVSSGTSAASAVSSGGSSGGLININTADKTTLMELPGIGEVYAQSIIDYRQSAGAFQKIEDIKNVSGIGDGKFQKIKDRIAV